MNIDQRRAATRTLLRLAVCSVALAGCAIVQLRQQAAEFYSSTVLVGRIDSPTDYQGPVIVSAVRQAGTQGEIVHQTRLHEPGGYELIVPQGEYALFAFGDANGNGQQDPGEPSGSYRDTRVAASGSGVVSLLDFNITEQREKTAAAGADMMRVASITQTHSTQAGAIADLDAPQFAAANGSLGYWTPMAFFRELGGNVYFLEPYDPDKIPILFVHGAVGSPQDWRSFFTGIDRTRYQPWFFYYPSGASLDSMAYLLYWKLLNLQLKYRFETLYFTAHSMGGLVVRTFLLNHGNAFPQARLFVSLSTPWTGERTTELGVRYSPAVVPSWRDMQPDGRFMQALFARSLPAGVDYYLLFGHRGGINLLRPNNDGTVTLASQLRAQAQSEARRIYGFDEDHASILAAPQVLAQYNAILASQRRGDDSTGQVHVSFAFSGHDDGAGLPVLVLLPVLEESMATDVRDIVLPLTAEDSGRAVGPIPAGLYDAGLVLGSYKTEPRRQRIRVATDSKPVVSFRLTAQGALAGYVGADGSAIDYPAGSLRPPHPSLRITSLLLTGPGQRRTLQPRAGGARESIGRYLSGQDDAYGPFFSFVDLPAGDYELRIDAEGYLPHTSRHSIVPGRAEQMTPIVLTPR